MEMKVAAICSLCVHVLFAILITIEVKNPFQKKIQQTPYVVFDYVQISPKSTAPILSKDEGRISSKKTSSAEESSNIESKPEKPKENSLIVKKPEENDPIVRKFKESPLAAKKPKEDGPFAKAKEPHKKEQKPKKEPEQAVKKNEIAIKDPKKKIEKKPDKLAKSKNEKMVITKGKPAHKLKSNEKSLTSKKGPSTKKEANKSVVNLKKGKNIGKKVDPMAAKTSLNSLLDRATARSKNANSGITAEEVGDVLTTTQIDLVRQKISKCWHFPAGLKNAEDLIVDIRMQLARDGSVKQAEIINKARMKTDSNFRTAAENAYRAVLDPNCNPLPLPPDKYEEWKDLELSFNPKEMME
jgi:outer membrane biosynthesis protein TonB